MKNLDSISEIYSVGNKKKNLYRNYSIYTDIYSEKDYLLKYTNT